MTDLRPYPSLFRYRIRGLAAGVHPVSMQAPAELLEMHPYFGTITVTGEVRVSESLHFILQLKGTAEFICDRCAKQFTREVGTSVDIYFEQEEGSTNHGIAEVFLYDPQQQEVDLTEVIRDHLMLGLPMKTLCSAACEGIPLEQWEPEDTQAKATLRELYEKLRSEEMNDESK